MSQSNALESRTSGPPNPSIDENCIQLMQNLAEFISASANLVQSLKTTLEHSKAQQNVTSEVELSCECIKDEEKNKSLPHIEVSQPLVDSKVELKVSDIAVEEATENPEEQPAEDTEDETKDLNVSKKGSVGDSKEDQQNVKKISVCDVKSICSKPSIKPEKSVSKSTVRNVKSRRQTIEKFKKEKTEKISHLKESLAIMQKNLVDIQEQVRQIDRLCQDYDTMNTPDGQVNPAALYKEIMKPQPVPFVSTTKSSTPYIQNSTSGCSPCSPCSNMDQSTLNDFPSSYTRPGEKISVLSTEPLDQGYY